MTMDMNNAHEAREQSRTALEEYAEEVFDLHVVALRIRRAIRAGRTRAQIPQEKPVDLSGTTAATLLVLHLESLGYATSWEEARKQDTREGTEIHYCELVVEWHERLCGG